MKDFSETRISAFEGLTVRRALALIESLQECKLRTEQQVRNVYSQNSERFDEALAFLIRLGIIRKSDDVLTIHSKTTPDSKLNRQALILSLLLRVRNRYRSEVFSYLRKYQIEVGELVYRPLDHIQSQESDVRNFLMEMRVVHYDREKTRYILSHDYLSIYVYAIQTQREVSSESLAQSIAARDEIGLMAEMEVITFEKDRLGPDMELDVDHVALRNVAAGYDIRSLTVVNGKKKIPRYIEVKAVSPTSMCFYWTKNEISVAKALQKSYFLYLLPVNTDGSFDLSSLKIIPDPHKVVLRSKSDWTVETDVIRCFLGGQQFRIPHQSTGVL